MAKSENWALVLRSTSFTIRARFTPASACSTLTRRRASARLCRFSLFDNFPLYGFFRLPSLVHRRFIALQARVLIQAGPAGITERFVIGNLLVVDLPGIGLTQVAYPRGLGMDDHHILVAVGLVLATIVQGLFYGTLRALATAVGPLVNQCSRLSFAACLVSKVARPAFGPHLQRLQGLLQHGQQVMDPVIHARLAQLEYLAQQRLQGVGLLVDQDKKQFLLRGPPLP